MPQKNTIKVMTGESYYHVYARGSSKQKIFLDAGDNKYFLDLLARYLSNKPKRSRTGVAYPHYRNRVELLAYCLMQNHFHLLVYQHDEHDLEQFMRSLMTSYARYFNLKYKRSGPVFESRYKAKRIDQQSYLEHISRYIHLNPREWREHKFSSIHNYIDNRIDEWLTPARILEMFASKDEYATFVADYEDMKQMLEEIKSELADK